MRYVCTVCCCVRLPDSIVCADCLRVYWFGDALASTPCANDQSAGTVCCVVTGLSALHADVPVWLLPSPVCVLIDDSQLALVLTSLIVQCTDSAHVVGVGWHRALTNLIGLPATVSACIVCWCVHCLAVVLLNAVCVEVHAVSAGQSACTVCADACAVRPVATMLSCHPVWTSALCMLRTLLSSSTLRFACATWSACIVVTGGRGDVLMHPFRLCVLISAVAPQHLH